MILNCNSCEKKFIVPDKAIMASGRLVQCSACGNKWKQFPVKIENEQKAQNNNEKIPKKELAKSLKKKIKKIKKRIRPNLYSPEYLSEKHGISINEKAKSEYTKSNAKNEIGFGFYNFLIISIIILIFTLRSIYFAQNEIVEYFPNSKFYIDYLFENIRNIKVIILSLSFGY